MLLLQYGLICLIITDLQYYRCILLVPDIYNRQHVKEIVNMLLLNMGFSGITQIHDLFKTE